MRIRVCIIPGSSKSDAEPGDPWRIHVHARPAEGKANDELVQVLSHHFGIAPSAIHIVHGHTTRSKIVEIALEDTAMTERKA